MIDSGHSLFGHNLYAYGNNNPVVYVDPSGCIPLLVITGLVGLLGGAIIGGCIAASKGESVLAGALVGGAVGGLIGVGAGALAGGLLGGSVLASGAAVMNGAATVGALGAGSTVAVDKTVNYLVKNADSLKRSATVMNKVTQRPYLNSTLTIREIMQSGTPAADASIKEGLKWVTQGYYNATQGSWELVVDVKNKIIVHYLFKK